MQRRWWAIAFYGGSLALLLLIVFDILRDVVPTKLAVQIGHNSEAFLLAVLVSASVQWLSPASSGQRAVPWRYSAGVAFGYLFFSVALVELIGVIDSAITTLNEAFFASAFITLYVALKRPLRFAPYLAVALLIVIVAGHRTTFVTNQAEGLVALMLAPVSFDVAHRRLVDSQASDARFFRLVWCLTLLLFPVFFMIMGRLPLSGPLDEVQAYGSRVTEAFWAFLLVHFYFSAVGWREPQVARISERRLGR